MNTNFMLKLSLLLTLTIYITTVTAQDSVKKATVKKTIVAKPVITAAQPGGIPINPKTGRPYSKYGYGPYAKTFRARQKADSLKKATVAAQPIHPSSTTIAITPPDVKADSVAAAPPRVDKSLSGQYQYLLTKVYTSQKPFVDAIWKNFTDTLKNTRGQLKAVNDKIAEQNKTIAGLQADVTAKEQTITQTETISLLGIDLAKSTYNIIMWGLVIAIGIVAGVVIARSGGAQKEATYRTTLYNELEEEFKTFKAKANEKEKKLARELQTERNRVDELTGRG
jgi:hypothetical protein